MRRVTINGRWDLQLPDHRADRPQWPYWEATRLAHMHHHLGKGGHVVYDVGAEEGDFAGLWALWGNSVVLFEPNPRVWPNIRAIFEASGLHPPLACFDGFASDESSETLRFNGRWPESADGPLIADHGFLNLSERPDVQRVRIDDMAGAVAQPTAITIDVEGAELHVLQGAEKALADHRPLVWVSVHGAFMRDMYGQTPAMLDAFMRDHDYEQTFLCEDHERHIFYSPAERGLAVR